MDSINSSPFFDPDSYPHIPQSSHLQKSSDHLENDPVSPKAVAKVEKVETFSSLFDDSELERLQTNLESIAGMAESALKQMHRNN